MLHDPSHKTVPEPAREIVLKQEEVDVNTRIFEEAAYLIDIFFIGNDFGSITGPLLEETPVENVYAMFETIKSYHKE